MTLRRCIAALPLLLATLWALAAAPAGADAGTTFVMDSPSVVEGDAGTSDLVFTVSLAGTPLTSPASVGYFTNNAGTATPPGDYAHTAGTLTFVPDGPTSQEVVVPVVGDLWREADETVPMTMTNPVNATVPQAIHVGTIVNDDPVPSITLEDGISTEGGILAFDISLSNLSADTVTVDYATVAGSADGTDYVVESGTVTFQAIFATQIAIDSIADQLDEPDETFTLVLSNPVNATIADGTAVGTIQDDDLSAPPPDDGGVDEEEPAGPRSPGGAEEPTTTTTTASPSAPVPPGPSTTAAPVQGATAAGQELPRTGGLTDGLALLGLTSVGLGVVLRRRSERLRAARW